MASNLSSLLNAAIRRGLKASATKHEEVLRKHAKAYGWPDHIAESLTFSADQSIFYPEHLADEIHKLEYGTQDVPPSPALRTFKWTFTEEVY